jgi:hypothetical protein
MTALFIYFATTNSGALGGLASLLVNKLSEERQVLVRRLEKLGMTLAMRLLLLSLGWGIGSPLCIILGQGISANVKIPSLSAHRSSDDPPARKEPRFVNGEEPLDMMRLTEGFGAH